MGLQTTFCKRNFNILSNEAVFIIAEFTISSLL